MPGRNSSFGPFRFNPSSRALWQGDVHVQLGSRASAILDALLETPGALVSRTELFERAWPGIRVDETNLKVQISGLRKALGDHGFLIKAEASFGYRFVGEVALAHSADDFTPPRRFRAPRTATVPIGRDDVIDNLADLLRKNRLVTILGPGGIGKTTVALATANKIADRYPHGTCFVDLGLIGQTDQVYPLILGSLDFAVGGTAAAEQVLPALMNRRLLLILDSCEHVIERVASLAELILSETVDIDVLITSRETLRVSGETVLRLDPLKLPPTSHLSVESNDLKQHASVELFLRAAGQVSSGFKIDDGNMDAIADICRRLDGLPLAIELAASMVSTLDVAVVRQQLDERFSLLHMDRRSTIARQRSLAATLDWSYALLAENERAVLRRLASFAGHFSLNAAIAIANDDKISAIEVRDAVVTLANKSFLQVNVRAAPPEYRLLEITRAYAHEAPAPPDERNRASERHARYFSALLEHIDWDAYDPSTERLKIRSYLEEVRSALDWSFRTIPALGVALALAAERLWLEFAWLGQGVQYLTLALREVDGDPAFDPLLKARVLVSVAAAQAYIMSPGHDDVTLYEQAWKSAKAVGDDFLQLRALYALNHCMLRRRKPLEHYLEEFSVVASRSDDKAVQHLPLVLSAYEDVEASDVVSSSRKLETFITRCPNFSRKYTLYFGHGLVVMCEVTFALMQYWMGYCDRARLLFASLVEEAEHRANATTLCFALAHGAIMCELRSGDYERANTYIGKLEELSALYKPWRALVDAYRAILIRDKFKDFQSAETLLNSALQNSPFLQKQAGLYTVLLFELAKTRLMLNDLDGAEATLEKVIPFRHGDHDARLISRYNTLLAKILIARRRPGDTDMARELIKKAVEVARFRGLYLFELEATIGFAELEVAIGRPDEAKALISGLLARSEDRDGLPDLAHARELLQATAWLN